MMFNEAEAQAEYESGLPQLCECGRLFQDCSCLAPAKISAPAGCTDDLGYWLQRAQTLLGKSVVINKIDTTPIIFNREDWTGSTGSITPTAHDSFVIDDIDGEWSIEDFGGLISVINRQTQRQYAGFWLGSNAYFSECGIQRADADPRVAFAKMKYNI